MHCAHETLEAKQPNGQVVLLGLLTRVCQLNLCTLTNRVVYMEFTFDILLKDVLPRYWE